MPQAIPSATASTRPAWLARALSPLAEIRAGEGGTVLLMLANIFVLLLCSAVIKTVREPLILLGGGAEARAYSAAGQALLLVGFVPAYSWLASRVGGMGLLVGTTGVFVACIEGFALAVSWQVPYVGVAFFIWVGIFNISLVAQFWSFANDLYTRDAGTRLFPVIAIGMTGGAPFGSFAAGRLFRSGMSPEAILHIAAALLALSALCYVVILRREGSGGRTATPTPDTHGGFALVLGNPYLRLVAALIILLNVVNTTGEYLVARLLSERVQNLAAGNPAFDAQAYIGAFAGSYQFWVNVSALLLQALVTSRLLRARGLAGLLFALPLIALGGYAVIAAGAGLGVVRWLKTAENAADYSLMNTARQLLWLPTTREEKYKAKQTIDTFFVRFGDVLSAGVVYAGTSLLQLSVTQFATVNVGLTLVWLGVVGLIVRPRTPARTAALRPVTAGALVLALLALASPAAAQETREATLAEARARKADAWAPPELEPLERHILRAERLLVAEGPVYPFIGAAFPGGGFAAGAGIRGSVGRTGHADLHAAWSVSNYRSAEAALSLPGLLGGHVTLDVNGRWVDAPALAFYGEGGDTRRTDRADVAYQESRAGAGARLQAGRLLSAGARLDVIDVQARPQAGHEAGGVDATYRRVGAFVALDHRTSPGYTRHGGLYRIEWSDHQPVTAGPASFQRLDADVQQFLPFLREHWVVALRALASTTTTDGTIPAVLLPSLGGSDALRGYPAWRFRGRHRLLLTGEYRWMAGPFVDMALFVDAGKVTDRTSDLDLRNMRTAHGIGLTVHTPRATVTRIELARTSEGTTLAFSFSPSF
ncbi:MAG: BamA/TamA family outer membrane protein [Vicinamibacterales bacterium]